MISSGQNPSIHKLKKKILLAGCNYTLFGKLDWILTLNMEMLLD